MGERTLGQYLRAARQARRLTQEQFGALIGLSDSYVSQIETGNRHPTADTLKAIARKTGLDYEEMARLAGLLMLREDAESMNVEDPELDLLFEQAKATLPPNDLWALKAQIRLAMELRREQQQRDDGT